jgi:predicted hotdog family 3-hydroxylacyl-ACP dehydratase
VNRDDIATRLPHGPGMVLLDRVVAWSADRIVCGADSHRATANPLRTARGLSPLAGIEYAGQAIALHAALASGGPLAGGVFAAVRDVRWQPADLSAAGGELIVEGEQLARSPAAATYRFRVTLGEREMLSGTALVAFRT